jgi:hypothetical protein
MDAEHKRSDTIQVVTRHEIEQLSSKVWTYIIDQIRLACISLDAQVTTFIGDVLVTLVSFRGSLRYPAIGDSSLGALMGLHPGFEWLCRIHS